jgi:hypothetical protein
VIHSGLLHNWLYVSSNIAILTTALVGEGIYLRNRRIAAREGDTSAPASATTIA